MYTEYREVSGCMIHETLKNFEYLTSLLNNFSFLFCCLQQPLLFWGVGRRVDNAGFTC